MEYRLSDAELSIMQIIWNDGPLQAIQIANIAKEKYQWEKNTTYTFIRRLIGKKAIKREDPGFVCHPLCDKSQISRVESKNFINKLYDGSINVFLNAFLNEQKISEEEIAALKKLIENYDTENPK